MLHVTMANFLISALVSKLWAHEDSFRPHQAHYSMEWWYYECNETETVELIMPQQIMTTGKGGNMLRINFTQGHTVIHCVAYKNILPQCILLSTLNYI